MRIQSLLKRKAIAWAGQMTRLARSFAPAHIRSAISSHVEEKNEGEFIIRTTANRFANPTGPGRPNYGSSDARAQEYGSGIHARRGPKQKYPIRPKNKKALVFMGTNGYGNEFSIYNPITHQGVGDKNIVVTKLVQHPGIEAVNGGKGYIGPAQIEIRKHIKRELQKELTEAIRLDLRESFGRK